MKRRRFLSSTTGVATTVGLAGCLGDDGENGTDGSDDDGGNGTNGGGDDGNGTDGNGVDPEVAATFEWEPAEPRAGEEVVFNAADSSENVVEYRWDFGAETESGTAEVTHVFGEAGEYTVKLVVEGENGATNSTSETVTVTPSVAQEHFEEGINLLVSAAEQLDGLTAIDNFTLRQVGNLNKTLDNATGALEDASFEEDLATEREQAQTVLTFQRQLANFFEQIARLRDNVSAASRLASRGEAFESEIETARNIATDELEPAFDAVEDAHEGIQTGEIDEPALTYDEPVTAYTGIERQRLSGWETVVTLFESVSTGLRALSDGVEDAEQGELDSAESQLETADAEFESADSALESGGELFPDGEKEQIGAQISRFRTETDRAIEAVELSREGNEKEAAQLLEEVAQAVLGGPPP